MKYIDNINLLRINFRHTYDKLNIIEQKVSKNSFAMYPSKSGVDTLMLDDGTKQNFVHSQYDPIREAKIIISQYDDVEKYSKVIFYGIGLGYHIETFIDKYPNIPFCIYEPAPDIFKIFLENRDLKHILSKQCLDIDFEDGHNGALNFLKRNVKKYEGNYLLIVLPVYEKIYQQKYSDFLNAYKLLLKNSLSSFKVNLAFEKRWITNGMKNFGDVLSTPNILIERKNYFKDKPAIIAAAGPSLNDEIENLRYIKEEGLAYIFSVGSAVNTLIANDIYPHAACTYDPTEKNQIVFQKIKDAEIKEIPLIFGSSVGFEVIEDYPGPKYHMITNQDTTSMYYLDIKDDENIETVRDAPTIAVVTLELLYRLGFNPIILVGQNLAHRGKYKYATGIDYIDPIKKDESKKTIYVKDVYGREVETTEGFNCMRAQMEFYAKSFKDVEVLNATKGGACIEGTEFVPLEDIMASRLKNVVVEDNWLPEYEKRYDKRLLESKQYRMNAEYRRLGKQFNDLNTMINKINVASKATSPARLDNLFAKFDRLFLKFQNNIFYNVFILPMNRVQKDLLINKIPDIQAERDIRAKAWMIVKHFGHYIELCRQDYEMVGPIYTEVNEAIDEYIKQSSYMQNKCK